MRSLNKAYIILTSVLVLFGGTCAYRHFSFERDKKNAVSALEEFYQAHSYYPKTIEELENRYSDRFYYYTDSTQQAFRFGYPSGIMECNNNYYDSTTKQWASEFVY